MLHPSSTLPRRRAVVALALSAGLTGPVAFAQAPVKLRYQQAFAPSASDLPLYAAAGKGFFKSEGLDVELRRSQDPANAVALVGAGEAELGMSYPPDVMLAAHKGMPLKGVWAWDQVNMFGIVSLADAANIRTPKDMVGKRIGLTSLPIDQLLMDAVLDKAGLSRKQIDIVNPGFSGGDLVGERKLDGASGVPWYEVDGLKAAGHTPVLMPYRDFGAPDFPFKVIIANSHFAQKNPEALKAFLRALRKATEFVKANPEESLDILLKAVPSLNRKRQEVAAKTMASLRESPQTAAHGFGYLNMAQLQALAEFLERRGALKAPLKASMVFTNEYR